MLESVSLAVEDALELLTVREEEVVVVEEEEEEEEEVVEVVVEVAVEEESRFRFFFFSGIDTYFSQRRQFRQLLVSAGSESLSAIFFRSLPPEPITLSSLSLVLLCSVLRHRLTAAACSSSLAMSGAVIHW